MRFVTAAILFVASAVLILTGIAERTVWHPAPSHTETITVKTSSPLIVIKHSVLKQYHGNPTVEVSSDSKPFMAVGRQRDIDAWVGYTPHVEVSAVQGAKKPTVAVNEIAGEQPSANPQGSDLWYSEYSKLGAVSAQIDPARDTGLLIAGTGYSPASSKINLTWAVVFNEEPSRNLIIAGGICLLLAVIANFWAWYDMRKKRGPRRRTPKAPHGPKVRRKRNNSLSAPSRGRRSARGFVATAAGVMVLASLTGCARIGAGATPTPTATQQAPVQQRAVVNEQQVQNIISRVSAAVTFADKAKDSKLLIGRVAGPALQSRSAYYTLEKASRAVPAVTPIPSKIVRLLLPAQTNIWPRTVMVVTSSGVKDELPQMLVLQQNSPREQYQLWYNIDMLPGVKFPVVNDAQTGAIPVDPDSQFLKLAPSALPFAFGDLVDNGEASIMAPTFDVSKDEYYQQIRDSQIAQEASLTNAKVKVAHSLGDANVLSLSTVNSGALVAVYLNDEYVIKPKDHTHAVAVAGNEKLMLGAAGSATGIRSTYGSMLLFYVPGVASKDKVLTLGATQTLLSVRGL